MCNKFSTLEQQAQKAVSLFQIYYSDIDNSIHKFKVADVRGDLCDIQQSGPLKYICNATVI